MAFQIKQPLLLVDDITGEVGYRNPVTGREVTIGSVRKLAVCAIPFGPAPTGTMANNGAVTLGTALPGTYTNCYLYFPASAISAGSAAGWYFCQMSSTTVGTVYNNTYVNGVPTIPTPVAFVTTGPGAYTGVIAATNGPQIVIPANTVGPNDALRVTFIHSCTGSTNAKTLSYKIGATSICSTGLSTAGQFGASQCWTIQNCGAQNVNVAANVGTTGGFGVQATPGPNELSIDFSQAQTVALGGVLAVATEYWMVRSFLIELIQG